MYKRQDGNTLALRPDITPSIARAAATLFQDEELPIRLCYTGSTFVNHSNYQGRLRETTQMGAELMGDDSVEADAEMLALVIESMLTIGLKEFQLSVGNVDFFQSLIEDACLDEEAELRVRELINNRNYFGAVSYTHLDVYKRQVFEDVPMGILAGKNAGMRVCAVDDDFSRPQEDKKKKLADYYIQDYYDIKKETYEVL